MKQTDLSTGHRRRSRHTSRWGSLAIVVLLLTSGLVILWGRGSAAKPQGPTANDRQVALFVSRQMERMHLSRRFLDNEISHRAIDLFLKGLDPMKVYFYQSDVDAFMSHRDELDDRVKRGDVSLAYQMFDRFLQRVDERAQTINTLLNTPHDFTSDEKIVVDRDSVHYPKDAAEAQDRWRKRIKFELLRQEADKVEPKEAVEKIRRRYRSIARQWHQTDDDELLQMYLSALTTSFDPHSTYMSKSTLENFEISMRLELDGIGASLQYVDGFTVVRKIIPGGAADKDGRLKPEDKIVAVGQRADGEMVDVVDMKLSDVVKKIRGKRGTIVRLGVLPGGEGEQKIYQITRARIELKDSEARSEIIDAGSKANGMPAKIGVIDLPSFYMDMNGARKGLPDYKSTTRDVRRLLDEFRQKGVDAVVVDLRGNGGGSLTEAINSTGLFIDQGPIVQVKGPDGDVKPYPDTDAGMAWTGPLVVVIDKFSASASEIFAGAIQDYHRGLIVGDHSTHGKGTVQQLFDVGQLIFRIPNAPNWGALKMTIQQFYRPSGDSTQNRGVVADVELPSLTTHWDVGEADLDFALAFDRVPNAPHTVYPMVDANLINALKTRSQKRMQESEDFEKLLKNIQRYKERKNRKQMTLNEEKFLADVKEFNADKEEEKQIEELNDRSDQVVKRDFYFDEVLAITLDYLEQLQNSQVVKRD
ncbi:MAG: carboxy terminal-processing peptidase [Pirellulales bacterium]